MQPWLDYHISKNLCETPTVWSSDMIMIRSLRSWYEHGCIYVLHMLLVWQAMSIHTSIYYLFFYDHRIVLVIHDM